MCLMDLRGSLPLNVARGDDAARCSFCGRSADQVEVLVVGMKDARICDNCAEMVVEMADAEKKRRHPASKS